MTKVFSSIACNLDANIMLASFPLFEQEKVEAVEWSFDTLFRYKEIPDWFAGLIKEYSDEGRLVGHGVFFSLFSGKWSTEQQQWLIRLAELSKTFQFDHITEHFGFMTGEDFHKGAPINVPFNTSTLALGRDRLHRIYDVCNCPVGLENLAFSYSLEEVRKHGDFLSQLIEPINGFIILDLHNLYCQIHNFNISYEKMLDLYPLEKVREIHISGGSWVSNQSANEGKIRRDTHDDSVPEEVFSILQYAIPKCLNLKFVVLEQLGTGLETEESQIQFRRDFYRMELIVKQSNALNRSGKWNNFLPQKLNILSDSPVEDIVLYEQQRQLSKILESAQTYSEANDLLRNSTLAHSDWQIETWEPHMLETALAIAGKWKNGF